MGDFWAFPAGFIISVIVSSVGISGGIMWMPFLLVALRVPVASAVATSLLIQSVGMASAAIAYGRNGGVDLKLAGFLMILTIPGIWAGAALSRLLSAGNLEMILGILATATALWFVFSHEDYGSPTRLRVPLREAARWLWIALPLSVGSGLLSTGLGEWLVPLLRGRLNVVMRSAIATCIVVAFGVSVTALAVHTALGARPDIGLAAWAIPGVITGGQTGPRITSRVPERLLKEIFIFALTLVGIHLIYRSYPVA